MVTDNPNCTWTEPAFPTLAVSIVPNTGRNQSDSYRGLDEEEGSLVVRARVGVDYKSPITITVPIKLSITITVVIEKAITITIIRLRLQLLVYHGNDSRLFIRHVHLQYYHA